MLTFTEAGLYCPQGDFYIDPSRPVPRAVITHGHADHARPGCDTYLAAAPGSGILRQRLGCEAPLETLAYGEPCFIHGLKLSFHPAGHILGSAQIRLELAGEVWVVSGDYKLEPDSTCSPFEPVPCHTFITESTFALPIYRWPSPEAVASTIHTWWQANQAAGKLSVLLAYSLGKAQRLLATLDPELGPIYTHGAVEELTAVYRQAGVRLPATRLATQFDPAATEPKGIVIAPPSVLGASWLRRFGKVSTGFASGWMQVRGARRRRAVDRGFVLSDHADWPGLLKAIEASQAKRIIVTHGYADTLVRYLQTQGKEAYELQAYFANHAYEGNG